MKVTKKVVDDVNIVLELDIEKADYAPAVEKELKEARKKVQMPGFRKGMVPAGMVKKMYGQQITVDEVNKAINKAMYDYISDNKLNVLGEPMVNEEQTPVDFETAEQFTVKFDIAIAPAFDLKLDSSVKVPYYTIKVSDKMVDDQIEGLCNQYGKTVNAEEATADDVIKGDLVELDTDGNVKEGGIQVTGATVYPRYFASDEEKKTFEGAKKGASVDFNPAAAYNNNASEIASLLQKTKEEVAGITANFRFTLTEINHREKAEKNEDFFQQVYGPECKTEDDFKAKVQETIASQLKTNSEYKFNLDAKDVLMKQVGTLTFPEKALKKWLLTRDEKRDAEQLDKDFPHMMEELTWQLIEEKIVADKGIKISDDDLHNEAEAMVEAQLSQYSMNNMPQEFVASYAESILKDNNQRGRLRDNVMSRKIMAEIKCAVKVTDKEVTLEAFQKMFE